jgi:predicted 2-oxoglutarate/Fe(II)-dependent dioxygenase YbiX
MSINKVNNYLPIDQFLKLQNYAKTTNDWVEFPDNPLWSNRTIDFSNIKDQEIKDIMSGLNDSIIKYLAENYTVISPLKADVLSIVRKYPSKTEPFHSDSTGNNGEENGTSHRVFSSLLYLNDEFDGGELLFHNQQVTVKPEPNMAVFFPSTFEYVHSVQELRSGMRYNVTMFWKYKGDE